jgi:hypothetical protein
MPLACQMVWQYGGLGHRWCVGWYSNLDLHTPLSFTYARGLDVSQHSHWCWFAVAVGMS